MPIYIHIYIHIYIQSYTVQLDWEYPCLKLRLRIHIQAGHRLRFVGATNVWIR